MFAGPYRNKWHRDEFYQTSLNPSWSTTPSSCYTVVIYGDNSFPGGGPLSKFL